MKELKELILALKGLIPSIARFPLAYCFGISLMFNGFLAWTGMKKDDKTFVYITTVNRKQDSTYDLGMHAFSRNEILQDTISMLRDREHDYKILIQELTSK